MKNYEDAIVEKVSLGKFFSNVQLRALKDAHGDNVDTLCIISRRHYNRTLTSVYKSPGAATEFLQQPTDVSNAPLERLLSESWTRWIDQYYLALGHGARWYSISFPFIYITAAIIADGETGPYRRRQPKDLR
jgi:hypothetical protein